MLNSLSIRMLLQKLSYLMVYSLATKAINVQLIFRNHSSQAWPQNWPIKMWRKIPKERLVSREEEDRSHYAKRGTFCKQQKSGLSFFRKLLLIMFLLKGVFIFRINIFKVHWPNIIQPEKMVHTTQTLVHIYLILILLESTHFCRYSYVC